MYLYQLLTNFGDGVSREGLLNVLAYIIAILGAIVLHELAHGLVALWNGDYTAKQMGRLTLNPLKHFDPLGAFMMLVVGFGWAKPVPVNPYNFKKKKLGCITVSVAGVVVNLTIAFFSTLGFMLLQLVQIQSLPVHYVVHFFSMLFKLSLQLNVSLALFNLLPLYPLDGYRLVASLCNRDNGFLRFLRKYSFYILIGFMLLDCLPWTVNYSPMHFFVVELGNFIIDGFVKFWGLFI